MEGAIITDEAKMIGITPDELILIGKKEDWTDSAPNAWEVLE